MWQTSILRPFWDFCGAFGAKCSVLAYKEGVWQTCILRCFWGFCGTFLDVFQEILAWKAGWQRLVNSRPNEKKHHGVEEK